MSASERTERIRRKASGLGFQHVGFAKAETLDIEAERLKTWLSRGYDATMTWMARDPERRIDPRKVFPGAKSIVAVAMNYYSPEKHTDEPGKGKVSRYAWGDDYHDIVGKELGELLDFITSAEPGAEGKFYVDTGPVLEKAWAQRAGIGWVGKHSNLISQEYGSWIFLGEIILNLELVYDTPATDHCGTCTLCLEACPTGAIPEPYVVDANRCISYLTIEHRGPIDERFAGLFGQWVYGCDICQDVCPWNRKFSRDSGVRAFAPRPQTAVPDIREWAEMEEKKYEQFFSNSPIKRAKRSGLKRNATFILEHRQ